MALLFIILGSFTGVASLVAAGLSIFVFRENRRQKHAENELAAEAREAKDRIDGIALGQSSLAAALERADFEIGSLRKQLDRQAARHENDRLEWRAELKLVQQRLEATETREEECVKERQELLRRVEELTT